MNKHLTGLLLLSRTPCSLMEASLRLELFLHLFVCIFNLRRVCMPSQSSFVKFNSADSSFDHTFQRIRRA